MCHKPPTATPACAPPAGVFYVRAGPGGNAVMEAWSSVEEKRISSEQQALNGVWKGPWEDRGEEKIFAKYGIPELAPEVPKGMTIMNKTVVVGQLSIALFGHSYTWFVTRVHQVNRGACWLCHCWIQAVPRFCPGMGRWHWMQRPSLVHGE